ncbi:MAG: hypothetical protein E6G50_03560 [Actinobacteria bacterium]|nr:MAG: hypothetical protein E6G50_03560 [Actinomycetota bacterium]
MPLVRIAAVSLTVLALAGGASAAVRAPAHVAAAKRLAAPGALHAFLPGFATGTTSFPRTPAFAWNPVRGAVRYELVLSTDPAFSGNSIAWDDATVSSPVAAVPISLPWITGTPHSLYARVRGIATNGAVGPWSTSFGFDMRWMDDGIPTALDSPPGLVRWTPVDGATAYQVWFMNVDVTDSNGDPSGASKIFTTATNVADEREYYTLHQPVTVGGQWSVVWRVRAVRTVYGALNNALPSVTYGPWSPPYVNQNAAMTTGVFTGLDTIGEPAVPGYDPAQNGFRQTPAFFWSGDTGLFGPEQLYRVYVFSDQDCVNPIFKGSIVGSPAYAPRTSGPLALPSDPLKLFKLLVPWAVDSAGTIDAPVTPQDGVQPTFSVDDGAVQERESDSSATFTPTLVGASTSSGSSSSGSSAPPSSGSGAGLPSLTGAGAPIGLWDTNWPVGRYYWTVVAAHYVISGGSSPHVEYWDDEVPQDVCSGRYGYFGVASQPAVTVNPANRLPFAVGLTTKGRLGTARSAKPTFSGAPLVAWQPAEGATAYEVQVSKTAYPWRTYGNAYTFATSITLPLKPGTWYYRVRGINLTLPNGASTMAWSPKVGVVIAKPKFRIG